MNAQTAFSHSSRVRRVRHLFGYIQDLGIVDLAALFRGRMKDTPARDIYVSSLVSGRAHLLTESQARLLLAVPSGRWVRVIDIVDGSPGAEEDLRGLVSRELLLTGDSMSADIEKAEKTLVETHWNAYAAIYHRMRRWKDVDSAENLQRSQDALASDDVAGFPEGPAPAHFYSASTSLGTRMLGAPARDSHLYRLLLARASRRAFDLEKELPAEDLSTILYYSFGCHGILDAHEHVRLLKKTSPSGGSLHPIEVYPLIRAVAGIPPGLYHYSVEHHVLETQREMSPEQVSEFAFLATAGQEFARSAHVLLLLTARFDREYWKYRRHHKAYGVLHMDVGHLSQTVYLLCTDLGLGACITGAINDANIDEELGLDGIREGALAVIACGVPLPERSDEEPIFSSYIPGSLEPRALPDP